MVRLTTSSKIVRRLYCCLVFPIEQKGSDAAAKFICRGDLINFFNKFSLVSKGLDMLGAANSDTSFHYFGVNKKKNAEMIVEFFKHIVHTCKSY